MSCHTHGAAPRPPLRAALLSGVSLLAVGLALLHAGPAGAQSCTPTTQSITGAVTGPVIADGGSIGIAATGVISGALNGVVAANCGITTLTNAGTIVSTAGNAVRLFGAVTTGSLGNSGLIESQAANVPALNLGPLGILGTLSNQAGGTIIGLLAAGLNAQGSIGTVTNVGLVTSGGTGTPGIAVPGHIDTLGNQAGGTITSLLGNGVLIPGSIGTLTNAGVIESQASTQAALFVTIGGSVGTLTNAAGGTIRGLLGAGLSDAGSIGTLTNSGVISGAGTNISAVKVQGGNLDTLVNYGQIVSAAAYGITTGTVGPYGTIGVLDNFGSIGGATAVHNAAGSIGSLTNRLQGTISGSSVGIYNASGLGTLSNSGTISGNTAISTSGSIGTLANLALGSILGNSIGISASGSIGTLSNDAFGRISGQTAISAYSSTIGTLSNAGVIIGQRYGLVGQQSSIGLLENLAGGSITGSLAGLSFTTITVDTIANDSGARIAGTVGVANLYGSIGTLANGGTISGITQAIRNVGSIGTLSNSGSIAGTTVAIGNTLGATIGVLANAVGGTIRADSTAINNFGSIGTLTNAGVIQSAYVFGVGNIGSIGTLGNSGSIVGARIGVDSAGSIGALANQAGGSISGGSTGLRSGGSIGTLSNSGVISGDAKVGLYNSVGGSIGLLSNAVGGQIRGASFGIGNGTFSGNSATIGTLYNAGTVSGLTAAIGNGGRIGTLTNIGSLGAVEFGVINLQTIGVFSNGGTIAGGDGGIANTGSIGALGNTGVITASADGAAGVDNAGVIGTLTNSGTLSGTAAGLANEGGSRLDMLSNAGVILGSQGAGIFNQGSIGSLANLAGGSIGGAQTGIANQGRIGTLSNSGTISGGSYAIRSTGSGASIGPILNSGVIQGNILIANQDVSITGSSAALYGALVGGTTTISGGNLTLAGNLSLQQDVIIRGGAGTVTNLGNLLLTAPQRVTGNYAQGSAGALVIGASSTAAGRLNVSGSAAMLNATVNLVAIGGYRFSAGTSYVLVDAATASGTSFTGTTATVAGFTATLATLAAGTDTELVLTLKQAQSYTQTGLNSGARSGSMGSTLDALASGSSAAALAFQNQVTAYIAALPGGAPQQNAVRETAPTQVNPAGLSFQLASSAVTNVIEAHQLGSVAQGPGGTGMAAGSTPQGLGLWMQFMGGFASRARSATTDGYNARQGGVMFGLDWQGHPGLLLGAGFSAVYGHATGNALSAGSSTNLSSYQLTGFGTWRFRPQSFLYGQLGAGVNDYAQSRAINFLGLHAHAGYGGQQVQAKLGLGHDIALPRGLTLTPLVGLTYARVTTDGYAETGAGAANLNVRGSGADALTQDVGARLGASYATGWGTLRPELRAAWTHDYVSGPIATTGTLAGAAFATTTRRLAADGARLGGAMALARSDRWAFRAEYEGDLRSNYASHSGLLRATMSW